VAQPVGVTTLWYFAAAALGLGGGAVSVRSFHRKYRVRTRQWLRFALSLAIGVPVLLALAWIFGEFNAFYLIFALSYGLTIAIGMMLWRPSPASDRSSPSAS
jgi:hypothetical protein